MRPIKFRAWDKKEKMMVGLGNLDEIMLLGAISTKSILDKYIVMQFTGLKDKNGNEIYEGDLIKSGTKAVTPFEVIYKKNFGARFMLKGISHPHNKVIWKSLQKATKLEIIGNIYENKDLLK